MVLQGHLAPVRGLVWSTELSYLLVSGSWDSTIRVWDTRDGTCVDAALDHGSDVYGQLICICLIAFSVELANYKMNNILLFFNAN